ncbi:MAG: hypothetical protein NVV68_18540 [Dokdonella sp.]|nr:hypothetical protein [Dokdonella sp.]
MAQEIPTPEALVHLTVFAVDSSAGLLRDGNYDYEFSADSVVLRHSPTTVVYALTESTQSTYLIEDVVTTDSKSQVRSIEIAKDGRSVTLVNLNTVRTLIYLTILVRDTSTRTLVNCDPQMTNAPPT